MARRIACSFLLPRKNRSVLVSDRREAQTGGPRGAMVVISLPKLSRTMVGRSILTIRFYRRRHGYLSRPSCFAMVRFRAPMNSS